MVEPKEELKEIVVKKYKGRFPFEVFLDTELGEEMINTLRLWVGALYVSESPISNENMRVNAGLQLVVSKSKWKVIKISLEQFMYQKIKLRLNNYTIYITDEKGNCFYKVNFIPNLFTGKEVIV